MLGPFPCMQDGVRDYLDNSRTSLRSPNLAFDEVWYRDRYREVDALIKLGKFRSGWDHYTAEGAKEFYNPAIWFDDRWYQKQYPEVAVAVKAGSLMCGFEHFLMYGARQRFSPSIWFNSPWYERTYMRDSGNAEELIPIVQYLQLRRAARPSPTPLFNAGWYAGQYLAGAFRAEKESYSPFEHYMMIGRKQGYSPSRHFDEAAYRSDYPEVDEQIATGACLSGFEHYVLEGVQNGYVAHNHNQHAGIDYRSPYFLKSYERSILLNLRQIADLHELVRKS